MFVFLKQHFDFQLKWHCSFQLVLLCTIYITRVRSLSFDLRKKKRLRENESHVFIFEMWLKLGLQSCGISCSSELCWPLKCLNSYVFQTLFCLLLNSLANTSSNVKTSLNYYKLSEVYHRGCVDARTFNFLQFSNNLYEICQLSGKYKQESSIVFISLPKHNILYQEIKVT